MRYLYHAMRMNLKSIAQYRASFLMQNIAQFIMVGGEFLAVVVLMTRFSSVGQWRAEEIMFFWGVMQFTFALCECLGRGISTFAYYVGSGDFDTMLIRPRPLMQQVMGHRLDPRRLGGMLVGGGAIALSCSRLGITWTLEKLGLTLLSGVGTFFLLLGLFALLSVLTVLPGMQAYRSAASRAEVHARDRVLRVFARIAVQAEDADGAVYTEEIGGVRTLTLESRIDGETYLRRIYCHDGVLRELFASAGRDFNPEFGEEICEAAGFEPESDGELLTVRITAPDGEISEVSIALRAAGL